MTRALDPTHPPPTASTPASQAVPIAGMVAVALLAAIALVWGWHAFWFLTDDAHIAFRYVSQSVLGHGFTWNAPPFRPVEGYTSFLWVLLLDVLWRATGMEPPRTANVLGLLFAFGSVALAATWVLRARLRFGGRTRLAFLALVLAATLSNRTFLAWTSSGMETAMFNFLVLWWLYLLCRDRGPGGRRRWLLPSLAAALLALARPDGLLFAAATGGWIAFATVVGGGPRAALVSCWPLAVVPAHFAWRLSYYHAWLPNTYHAKVTSPWPEAGIRYVAAFALEYAYGVWALVAVACTVAWLRRRPALAARHAGPLVAIATCLLHAGFYVLRVGGDHFEWRVFSHLVIPLAIALVVLLDRSGFRPGVALAAFAAWLALSLPLPWIHWAASRNLRTREATYAMKVPVAPLAPPPLRWVARRFDSLQAWLIDRGLCNRHREHQLFYETQRELWPAREEGVKISGDGYPVLVFGTVGYPGWVLPHVAILDRYGLNDYVVARSTIPRRRRIAAHEKMALVEYLKAFRPDLELVERRLDPADPAARSRVYPVEGRLVRRPRAAPLAAEEIRAIEAKWWALADSGALHRER